MRLTFPHQNSMLKKIKGSIAQTVIRNMNYDDPLIAGPDLQLFGDNFDGTVKSPDSSCRA
jgi:hypothetical protein